MTQPVGVGYPDWGRFQATSTKIYFNGSYAASSQFTEVGEFFVGDAPYVVMQVGNGSGDRVQFFVDFRQTSGGLFNLAAQTFVVSAPGSYAQTIPVCGPWMVVAHISGGAASTGSIRMSGSWVASTFNDVDPIASILQVGASSIAAGANLAVETSDTWPGLATVSLQASQGNARLTLSAVDRNGTTTIFYRMSTTGPGDSKADQVYIPPTPVEVLRTNDHSSSQTVRSAVSARPIAPGW